MNKRIRLGLVLVAIVVIGLVAATAVFVYTADYSRIKALIETKVSDATGRKLTIAGDLTLSISLNPQLVTGDVTLANASWGSKPGMLKIGKLKAGVKLLPLFVGDVEIDDIQFTDTVVLLETDANGQGNWHFTTPKSSHKGISIKRLGVSQLNLQRFAVTYRNGQTQSTEHYTVDNLELNRLPGTDLLSVALTGDLNGQPATLSGQTGSLFMSAKYPVDLSGEVAGVAFKLKGEIGNLLQAEDLDLAVQASGTNLATLGTGIDVVILKTDSFSMSAQLAGSGDAVTMSNASATIKHSGVMLAITGGIGNLNTLEGMHFELTGSGNNLSELQAIAGSTQLPDTGPFKVSGTLNGSAKALSLTNAQGDLRHHSIKLALSGKIQDVIALTGIDLNAKVSGNNLSELQAVAGSTKLPDTGPFKVSGTLNGSTEALSLTNAQGDLRHHSIKLALSGKVQDVIAFTGIDVNAKLSGNNLSELQAVAGSTKLPDTGPFTASARLTGTAKALALLDALTVIKQKGSQLKVSGKIANLQQLSGIDLSFKGSAKDFTELGPTFRTQLPDLGAFQISGQLLGSSDTLDLKGISAVIDQSDFSAAGRVTFGQRPKVSMRIESALIDFTRLMGETEKLSQQETSKVQDPEALMFSKKPIPFNLLDAVDADIELNAKRMKARDAELKLDKLALRLDTGELRIDTLEATYKETRISASLNIKTGTPAQVAAKILVQDFDLGSFLKETHKIHEVEGHADFAVDLRSQGDSPHSLMAALDGTTGAVIGKGRVPHILDVLAKDLTSKVLPFWGNPKHAGELDCGVIEFSIKQGIATSKTFLLDTHLGHYKVQGHTNWGTEKINFLLIPKPKKLTLLSMSTKLRITGSINHPEVHPTVSGVLETVAEDVLTFTLGPIGLLIPFERMGAQKKHPCDMQKLKHTVDAIYN